MKLRYKKAQVCYYCGNKADTREHVPPRQMFRDFNCDSITVPSCQKHNCSKSSDDQAIINALLIPIKDYANSTLEYKVKLNKDILRATYRLDNSLERIKNMVIKKSFLERMPDELKHLPDIAFLKSPIKFYDWVKKITAGMIYYGIGYYDSSIDWDKIDCWSLDYYAAKQVKNDNEKIEILIKYDQLRKWFATKIWHSGWTAYPRKYPPDIYRFAICFDFDDITIRHSFYNSYHCYTSFTANQKLKELISARINQKR